MPRKNVAHANPFIETIKYGYDGYNFYKNHTKIFLEKPLHVEPPNKKNNVNEYTNTFIEWLNPDDLKTLDLPFEKITNKYIKFLKSIKEYEKAKYWFNRDLNEDKNELQVNMSKKKMDNWYNIMFELVKSSELNFDSIQLARKEMYNLYKNNYFNKLIKNT